MQCPKIDEYITRISVINALLDRCEMLCDKYYNCDTVALMNDKLKELELKQETENNDKKNY